MLLEATLALALAAPPAVPTSNVRIETESGASITWEGAYLGSTDSAGVMAIEGVPPGIYSMTIEAEGFATSTLRIKVAPGDNRLALPLTPAGGMAGAGGEEIETPRPSPVTPPLAEPTGAAPEPVATEEPASGHPWLIAAAAFSTLLLIGWWLRRRAAAGTRKPAAVERMIEPDEEYTAAAMDVQPPIESVGGGFLDDLRRRERQLERFTHISGDEPAEPRGNPIDD